MLLEFLSHVLRNFIEERDIMGSHTILSAIFLSHVLRNFIEDGLRSLLASCGRLFLSHVLRNFIEETIPCASLMTRSKIPEPCAQELH